MVPGQKTGTGAGCAADERTVPNINNHTVVSTLPDARAGPRKHAHLSQTPAKRAPC